MQRARSQVTALVCLLAAALLYAGRDSSHFPSSRPESPKDAPEGSILGPIDLVYVCGNRFLISIATKVSARNAARSSCAHGEHYMTLTWTGATRTMVDVYRNGVLLTVTENDEKYVNSRKFIGQATYRYKVCQTGTATCSNEATVMVE